MILTTFFSWTGLFLAAAIAFGGLQVDHADRQLADISTTQLLLAR